MFALKILPIFSLVSQLLLQIQQIIKCL